MEARTHQGIITMIRKFFIKEGLLPMNVGKTMKEVFVLRQEADYDDFIDIDRDSIKRLIPEVNDALIALISKIEI